jgi:hypothetical protein
MLHEHLHIFMQNIIPQLKLEDKVATNLGQWGYIICRTKQATADNQVDFFL